MKFFGARDELFEIMAQAAAKNRPGATTTTTTSTPAHVNPVVGVTPTPSPTPTAPASAKTARPSHTTTAALARAGIQEQPRGAALLGKSDVVEIDGEALIVIDDEAEIAPPPPTSDDGMRLFSLRMDTVVVGGVLCAGLLLGSFLLGRSSAGGDEGETAKAGQVANETVPPDVQSNPQVGVTPGSQPQAGPAPTPSPTNGGTTTLPAGSPREAPAGPAATSTAKPTHAMQVCHTSPEKAASLAKWLNEDPRSPIFGRADLEATVKGGSVRITGFTREDNEVLGLVRATSDPTGGSGKFGSAYYLVVK